MTAEELWKAYQQINPEIGDMIDAWAFGAEPDLLAQLVLEGTKTATASAYDEYLFYKEPLGQIGDTSVILDSQENAVCIIRTTKVSLVSFDEVSQEHAFKEGEGDKSLAYWRQVHEKLFTEWLGDTGISFTPKSKVVLEEFEVVFSKEDIVNA